MHNIVKDYTKLNGRNHKKDNEHLNKHAMHLIRLYLMCIDILEKQEINTYREKEHDLLMNIRNGKYQNEYGTFQNEFFEMVDEYQHNMEQAMKTLLAYENVKMFYFQNDREIITDLENYMDILHFSPEINHYICDSLIAGKRQVNSENYAEEIRSMRDLAYERVEKLVLPYEDRIKVDIFDE